MDNSRHTPGPWQFVEQEGERKIIAADKITMCDTDYYPWCPDRTADWQLIAAAPELLDELKRMRRAYVSLLETGRDRIIQAGGQCDSVEEMEAADPNLKSSRAAIAKATGENK